MNNINFLLTISTHNRQKRLLELKKKRSPKGNDLIIYQIISFSSSTKSMEISLTHRRFEESSYFVPPHKRLLNSEQHSFHTLSQSHFTFQILEGWPRPQGNPIITRSARNSEKALISFSLRAAKLWFTQPAFRILRAMHYLSEGKKRRKKVTLGSRFFTITNLWGCVKPVNTLSQNHKQWERNVVLDWADVSELP